MLNFFNGELLKFELSSSIHFLQLFAPHKNDLELILSQKYLDESNIFQFHKHFSDLLTLHHVTTASTANGRSRSLSEYR